MLTDGGAVTRKPGLGLFFWWRVRCIVVAVDCALAVLEGSGLLRGPRWRAQYRYGKQLCPPMNPSCRSCHGRGRR